MQTINSVFCRIQDEEELRLLNEACKRSNVRITTLRVLDWAFLNAENIDWKTKAPDPVLDGFQKTQSLLSIRLSSYLKGRELVSAIVLAGLMLAEYAPDDLVEEPEEMEDYF